MTLPKYFFILVLFLFAGCKEEFPTYEQFCSTSEKTLPACLRYDVFDAQDKVRLVQVFGKEETPSCPYHVVLTRYHVGECNNPAVKSRGSDFNGYVRVEIKKGFKCYYKVQSDYKEDISHAFENVLQRISKTFSPPK